MLELSSMDDGANTVSVTSSRIQNLPQELRDCIYKYTLEPTAVFLHTNQKRLDPSYSLPTMTFWEEPGQDIEDYPGSYPVHVDTMTSWDPNFVEDFCLCSPFLAFKILISTPLLLVSKKTSQEVSRLRESLRSHYEETIKSTIYLHRIVSPSPLFLNICSRSRFVLGHSAWAALYFFKNLPPCMKLVVRDIVVTQHCVHAGLDSNDRFSWYPLHDSCHFTNVLRDELPNLQSIGVAVPSTTEGLHWYAGYAPRYLRDLLSTHHIDTLRFLYNDPMYVAETDEQLLDEVVGRLNTAAPPEPCEGKFLQVTERQFDVIEEVNRQNRDSFPEWKRLGFTRVVKITRWTDTQLGTATFTKLRLNKWRRTYELGIARNSTL